MAAENIDYTLSINVEKDVADLVINDDYSYMPVVEILQDTAALILTNDEKIEWVEVNKNAPSYPTVYDKKGGEPVFVQDDDDSPGRFDIKFSAPKPDSKDIWFAIQPDSLLGPDIGGLDGEGDQQHPSGEHRVGNVANIGHIEPLQLTQDELGKAFLVDERGKLSEIGVGDDDHGIRKKNSIGIINKATLNLFFWILPKHSDPPDLDVEYQQFKWLPGSGRIQLPHTSGKGLKVKVWLEALSNDLEALGGITFQDQTQKIMVRYKGDATDAEVMMNNLGVWLGEEEGEEERPVQKTLSKQTISKTTSNPAWKGPQTLSSKASAKKRLTTNGTAVGRA